MSRIFRNRLIGASKFHSVFLKHLSFGARSRTEQQVLFFAKGAKTMKTQRRFIFVFLASALFLIWVAQGRTEPVMAQDPDIRGPFVGEPLLGVSFDGDVRNLPQKQPTGKNRVIPLRQLPNAISPSASFSDAARQTQRTPVSMPSPNQNFKGLDLTNWGAGWPPDTNGDVGPNHYIQTVNTSIGIFNKTGTRLAAFTFDSFFTGATSPCNTYNNGDPVVLYDASADRWVITDFAWISSSGPYYECIAVSKTGDPVSGGWWLYTFQAHATLMNDYPKLGVWPDGYYMSANMFTTTSYSGTRVWALDRTSMLSGTLREVHFDLSSSYFSLLPSNLRGVAPPAGTPNIFAALNYSTYSGILLWKFHVDWTTPSNSTFTGPTSVSVTSFSSSGSIPQQGSTVTLDSLSGRLMMQNQYRNIGGVESVWLNHTVSSGGVAGVRWYEIRNPNGTPSVYQQSTYQPDSTYRWMGSLAIDQNGDMALGFSASSSSMYPAIRYAGRLVTDSLSTLGQGETTLIAGTGAQTNYSRWGDYSAMTIDPTDDCTFWFTTEYYETTGTNWQTRIGSFKFPSCGPVSPPGAFNKSSPSNGATGVSTSPSLGWGSSSGATSYEYCYDTTNNNSCDGSWTNVGSTTNANPSGLASNTTYYWQVRARNSAGTVEANGGTWWNFTTINVSCYTLTTGVSPNGSGTVNANPAPNCNGTQYSNGTVVNLTAAANSGYTFSNWSGDASGSVNPISVTMNVNRNVTANFTTITVPNDDFNSPKVISTTPYTDAEDTTNATTATDDPIFTCGSGNQGSKSVWYRFTPSANGTLAANTIGSGYDTMLAVWTGSRGSLSSVACDDDSGGNYTSQLQTTVTSGMTYSIEVARYGTGSSGGPMQLAVNFTPTTACYTLTTSANPSSGGTVNANPAPNCNSGTQYISGTVVALTAMSNTGYVFSSWSGSTSGSVNPTSVTMNASKSVTANFVVSNWVTRASMTVARSRPAVAAVNGKVYVIGGQSPLGPIKEGPASSYFDFEDLAPSAYETSIERYDPVTNAWATQTAKPTGVINIGAGVINNQIYVPGGYDGANPLAIMEMYDPVTNSWSAKASLPAARFGYAAAVVNNKLYVIGGNDGSAYQNTCYVYDPVVNSWSSCTSMTNARAYAGAGVVNGMIYVVGGGNGSSADLNYVEKYDPSTNTWSTQAPLTIARGGPGAVGVGNYLYVCGGGWSTFLNTCERYDPAINSWSSFDPMNVGRRTFGLVEANGKLYAEAGYNGNFLATNEEYPLTSCYTLATGVSPSGSGTVSISPTPNCNNYTQYVSGTVVTLTATANTNYAFSNWSGDASGSANPTTVTMTANKNVIANFATTQIPDLIVQSITWTPTNPAAGQPVTFTVRIKNQGTGPATPIVGTGSAPNSKRPLSPNANFWVDFYVDHQPTGCGDYASVYFWSVASLAPGATQDLTFTYTGLTTAGAYNLWAFVDSGCNIPESNETNNTSQSSIQVAPPNDDFNFPKVISTTPYTDAEDTTNATTATDDPIFTCGSGNQGSKSVWYRFTPSTNGTLAANTIGSGYDTMLAVWTGSRGSLSSVACNDDSGGNLTSQLTTTVTSGTTYYIEVARYGTGNSGGPMQLAVSFTPTIACYTLTTSANPSGGGTVNANPAPNCNSGTQYISGTVVALTATANTGYVFSSWSGNASGSVNPTSVTMSASKSITANFVVSNWIMRASMSVARVRPAVAAVNGKVYVIGGQSTLAPIKTKPNPSQSKNEISTPSAYETSIEEYNPTTNTWASKAPKPTGVSNAGAAVVNNKIYVAGGYNGTCLSTLEVYDLTSNSWTVLAPLPSVRCGAAVASVNNQVYAIGGNDGTTQASTCFVYNPTSNIWSACTSMTFARTYASAGVVNGKIYVVGGIDYSSGTDFNYVEEYNPATNTWATKTPLTTPRGGPGAVGVGNYLYVCGGGWSLFLNTCERYDPLANSWSSFDTLNVGRATFGMAEANGKLYAEGGFNGNFLVTNEEYPLTSCYTLTTSSNPSGGGIVDVNPAPNCNSGTQYVSGTVVTLTATANTGYAFSNWSGDTSGSTNPTTVTMSANRNVTANFASCYTLTTSSNPSGGGIVGVNPAPNCNSGTQYVSGTVVTLTATANTGYAFSNWSGDTSGSTNPTTVTLSANRNVTANFASCYTLTTSANPGGGGSIGVNPAPNCNAGTQYVSGTVVTLTATANNGYGFNNWSGDASGSANPITITMSGNKNVIGVFIQLRYLFLPLVIR